MQNAPNNPSQADEKIVREQDLITVGRASPLADRESPKTPPLTVQLVPIARWKKSVAAIGVGIGLVTFDVTMLFDRPVRSTAPSPATSKRSIPKQRPQAKPSKIAIAQAALKEAKAAITLSQERVAQAHVNLQAFQTNYDRQQQLYTSGTVDRQKLAQAKVAADFAKTQKSHALHGLNQAQLQLTAAEEDISEVRSQLAQGLPATGCKRVKKI
jgi:hypothetical protein